MQKADLNYEHYCDVRDAIARESQLKKWSRAKKIALISRLNPSWLDLGADVLRDR
jgi:putative endonuclease